MTSDKFLRGAVTVRLASLLLAAVVGCSQSNDHQLQGFDPHGRHGGHTIAMPGDAGYELEVALDERRRRMVIYVENSTSHKPHPLAIAKLDAAFVTGGQRIDAAFLADPRESDPQGAASRFAIGLDELPQQLLTSNQFALELTHTVAGDPVTVSIAHNNDHGHEYNHD